jgi:hypothetical protein
MSSCASEQFLPHAKLAGSIGEAKKRPKVTMLITMTSNTPATSRRMT